MPIYEYQCKACGHCFDKMQKMSDAALTTCPECQKEELQKLVSAAKFKLTGTGWYETDFKDKGKPPQKKAEGETKKDTKASADSKPESSSKSDSSAKSKESGSTKE